MTTPTEDLTLDDVRTARLHMLLSTLAIGLMGLALFLGWELTHQQDGQVGRSCTEENEVDTCEDDESCVDGVCKYAPERQPQRCQEGDPCDACACEGSFACDAGVCRPLAVDQCSTGLLAVLRETRQFEREQCRGADGKKATTCEAKDLARFFLEHRKFNTLLMELKHRATIHFDNGQPGEDGLPPAIEAHYAGAVASMKQRLLEARHILVIGRASTDGGRYQSLNYTLAQMRMVEVQRWVTALADTPQGRDELEKKMITLAIGTASPLDPELLAKDEFHHFITASERSTRRLQDEVLRHASLTSRQRLSLSRRINQSVLVVPVPCEIPDDSAPAAAQP